LIKLGKAEFLVEARVQELRRVLKSRGQILTLEHVRKTAIAPPGVMLDLSRNRPRDFGPELNRDIVDNAEKARFRLRRVESVYLDVIKFIEGQRSILSIDPTGGLKKPESIVRILTNS
jgi:hypothetical protein